MPWRVNLASAPRANCARLLVNLGIGIRAMANYIRKQPLLIGDGGGWGPI
jgi:hypothetical protein